MKTRILLLLFISLISCKTGNNTNQNSQQEKILNIKNISVSNVRLILVDKKDSLTINLPKDSIYELISLSDNCNSFEQTLKEKYNYLSYQKLDSFPKVLIDKNNNILLKNEDIIINSDGHIFKAMTNNKEVRDRIIFDFKLK